MNATIETTVRRAARQSEAIERINKELAAPKKVKKTFKLGLTREVIAEKDDLRLVRKTLVQVGGYKLSYLTVELVK